MFLITLQARFNIFMLKNEQCCMEAVTETIYF